MLNSQRYLSAQYMWRQGGRQGCFSCGLGFKTVVKPRTLHVYPCRLSTTSLSLMFKILFSALCVFGRLRYVLLHTFMKVLASRHCSGAKRWLTFAGNSRPPQNSYLGGLYSTLGLYDSLVVIVFSFVQLSGFLFWRILFSPCRTWSFPEGTNRQNFNLCVQVTGLPISG